MGIGYNRIMKTAMTYRMIAILTIALMFAPVLNYSFAQSMNQGDLIQQQNDITSSSKCHQTSNMDNCKHCDISLDSHSCDHSTGACGGNCGHYVISVAITSQASDRPNSQQILSDSLKKLTLNVDLDTQLRPPQFA